VLARARIDKLDMSDVRSDRSFLGYYFFKEEREQNAIPPQKAKKPLPAIRCHRARINVCARSEIRVFLAC
jgi:hypothetical protein